MQSHCNSTKVCPWLGKLHNKIGNTSFPHAIRTYQLNNVDARNTNEMFGTLCMLSIFIFPQKIYVNPSRPTSVTCIYYSSILIKLTIHRIHSFGAITYANNPLPIQITILPREFYLRGNFHIWLIIVLCKQSDSSTSLCVFGLWTCQRY